MRRISAFALPALAGLLLVLAVPAAQAQISGEIEANLHHSFIVGNATLPPGRYMFRMVPDTDLTAMSVTSADGATSAEFLVRTSDDAHMPRHSELIFNKYGSKEYLTRIYETGTKAGVAVVDESRSETRLKKHGQHAMEHTEEQAK